MTASADPNQAMTQPTATPNPQKQGCTGVWHCFNKPVTQQAQGCGQKGPSDDLQPCCTGDMCTPHNPLSTIVFHCVPHIHSSTHCPCPGVRSTCLTKNTSHLKPDPGLFSLLPGFHLGHCKRGTSTCAHTPHRSDTHGGSMIGCLCGTQSLRGHMMQGSQHQRTVFQGAFATAGLCAAPGRAFTTAGLCAAPGRAFATAGLCAAPGRAFATAGLCAAPGRAFGVAGLCAAPRKAFVVAGLCAGPGRAFGPASLCAAPGRAFATAGLCAAGGLRARGVPLATGEQMTVKND